MPAEAALSARVELERQACMTLKFTLKLSRGVTVLVGPSGAGKSTTLDILAGHLVPDRGDIKLDGETIFSRESGAPPSKNLPAERRRIGYVMQSPALFPHLNVRHNLAYGLANSSRAEQTARIAELCELLSLGDLLDRWPSSLSGGERQRVALARALAPRPRALLLDEPLSAVDLLQRDALLENLRRALSALDIPVLYVTHSAEEQRFFATANGAYSCSLLRMQPQPDGAAVEIVPAHDVLR